MFEAHFISVKFISLFINKKRTSKSMQIYHSSAPRPHEGYHSTAAESRGRTLCSYKLCFKFCAKRIKNRIDLFRHIRARGHPNRPIK